MGLMILRYSIPQKTFLLLVWGGELGGELLWKENPQKQSKIGLGLQVGLCRWFLKMTMIRCQPFRRGCKIKDLTEKVL